MDILKQVQANLFLVIAYAVGAVLLVLLVILKKRITEWLKKHFVAEVVANDAMIKELLVEIRIKTKADRVSIFMFHNGERYVNGSSMLRISGSYESLGTGVSSHKETSQNVLLSTVSESVSFLVDEPCQKVSFQKVSDLEECYYRAVLISQGVQSFAKYPLKKGEDIIGFLCADYVKTEGPEKDDDLKTIKDTAPQIELHLNGKRGGRIRNLLAKVLGGG